MLRDKLSILIIDDQPIVRWALRHLFEARSDIDVLADVDSLAEAVGLLRSQRPEVVIMGISPPDEKGIASAVEFLKNHPCKAVAFTECDNWSSVESFMQSGGLGFASRRSSLDEISQAVKAVAQGRQWISPALRAPASIGCLEAGSVSPEVLSPRESEIAQLIAKGLTSKQIADQLCVSLKTIEAHRYRVFKKLHIRRSAQLVDYVLRGTLPIVSAAAAMTLPLLSGMRQNPPC